MIGFGTTRAYKLQDLEWKYSILTQTESGKSRFPCPTMEMQCLMQGTVNISDREEDYQFILPYVISEPADRIQEIRRKDQFPACPDFRIVQCGS